MLRSIIRSAFRNLIKNATDMDSVVKEKIMAELQENLPSLLRSELRETLLSILHESPKPIRAIDYEQIAYLLSAVSSAEYVMKHMSTAPNLGHQLPLLKYALDQCGVDGVVMEFGVYQGNSLRAIANHYSGEVHGFDSFEGLPEDWTHFQRKGRFSLGGVAPQFAEKNIHLHVGWFEKTLPEFLAAYAAPARFIHIDSDLYSSAAMVLENLSPRIISGTVIVFDEYLNYPNWQLHEYKAFQEFIAKNGRNYQYIGFASSHYSVAVKMV